MNWNELVGFAAAMAVLASFSMSSMISLRSVAVLSNILFITYGVLGHIHPVLFLHATLLPINLLKLCQIARLQNFGARQIAVATWSTGYREFWRRQKPAPDNRTHALAGMQSGLK